MPRLALSQCGRGCHAPIGAFPMWEGLPCPDCPSLWAVRRWRALRQPTASAKPIVVIDLLLVLAQLPGQNLPRGHRAASQSGLDGRIADRHIETPFFT